MRLDVIMRNESETTQEKCAVRAQEILMKSTAKEALYLIKMLEYMSENLEMISWPERAADAGLPKRIYRMVRFGRPVDGRPGWTLKIEYRYGDIFRYYEYAEEAADSRWSA